MRSQLIFDYLFGEFIQFSNISPSTIPPMPSNTKSAMGSILKLREHLNCASMYLQTASDLFQQWNKRLTERENERKKKENEKKQKEIKRKLEEERNLRHFTVKNALHQHSVHSSDTLTKKICHHSWVSVYQD